MADEDREMRKKPEDLATSYYKMLQDLHQVDKKLQQNQLDAYTLRHRMEETLEEMKEKRLADERAAAEAPSEEKAEAEEAPGDSGPPTHEELSGFAAEYLLRRQKEKGESPFAKLE